jgi:hypothetical protein
MNIAWLRQALELLDSLDDRAYATSPSGMEPHRAGGHLRHVVEFYQAFLRGLESSHIDYDARPRNLEIELSRNAAEAAVYSIINALQSSRDLRSERIVWVRLEDAPRFARWLLKDAQVSPPSAPEQHVALPRGVPITIAYLDDQSQMQLASLY